MGCISGTTTNGELSQSHDGEADAPYKYTNPPEIHTNPKFPVVAEISAAAPESPEPPLSNNVLSSNDTAILDYIGIILPPKQLPIVIDNNRNTATTTTKTHKLSLTALQNRFRAVTSNNSIKHPKYGTNEIYKSSPEQSEIKEQEASNSKRSKSKDAKHESKKLRNYKFSSSDTASILDINNEDSSSYEFESITKLTAFTNLATVETPNTVVSDNDTMIENDTIMAMSPIHSHLSTNTSIVSQASTNRISLKLNQTSFKPNIILPSSSKYKGIENPFYHSEDGHDEDEEDADDDDDDVKSDSSYYNNYNWYQPFKRQSIPKALAYSHSNKVINPAATRTAKHFVPHSVGDKVKVGASYPFVSKRSMTSSYNSMQAQGSTSVSRENNKRDYNPFRQKRSVYPPPPHLESADTADSDGTVSSSAPYPHAEYYNVTFGTRRCPPPHAYNHYSHSLENGNQSDLSTHV